LGAKTSYGGGTSKDITAMTDKQAAEHEIPVGANSLRPGEFQKYDAQGNRIGLTTPPTYSPNVMYPNAYGNQFQTYDMNQLILQQQQDLTKRINTLDITTLGWSPM
jgi:hypothetical protein